MDSTALPCSDEPTLPAGMVPLMKAACREYTLALGTAKEVAAVIGKSPGFVSKAMADHYPETLSLRDLLLLEVRSQRPILATLIAGLTAHQVVPTEDEAEPHLADHLDDMVGIAGAAAKVTAHYGESLKDRRMSPGEARAGLTEFARLKAAINTAERRLASELAGDA